MVESAPKLSQVRRAIPRELFLPNDVLALRFLARAFLLLAACTAFGAWAYVMGFWALYPLSWFATGTVLFGWFEIAHNCGHHAYFSSKRVNRIVGHLATIPLMYPFTQWKLWHDAHHRRPNATGQTLYEQFCGEMNLKPDTAFAPLELQHIDRARSAHPGAWIIYRVTRACTPIAVFLAPLLLSVFFSRTLREKDRRDCRRSLAFTLIVVPTALLLVRWASGTWFGVWHLWLFPLGVYAAWLGYYALLQHTGESIPIFSAEEWTNQAQFLAVVNTQTPRLISWIHGGGEFHCVHHIAPTLPNYHLARAQAALEVSEYAEWIHSVPFSLLRFYRIQRDCQVWDTEAQCYRSLASLSPPGASGPEPRKEV